MSDDEAIANELKQHLTSMGVAAAEGTELTIGESQIGLTFENGEWSLALL